MVNHKVKESRIYFEKCWGRDETPKKLPLHGSNILELKAPKGYYNFNPTIINLKLRLEIYTRISNVSFSSRSDRRGKFKPRGKDHPLENQIVSYNYHSGEVDKEKEICSLQKTPNYEDPRAIIWRNEVWLVVNKVTKIEGKLSKNWCTEVTLLNPLTKEEIELESPWNLPIEKNWSFVSGGSELSFLYLSNPQVLVSFGEDGKVIKIVEEKSRYPLLNGGSPFIALAEDRYLRVARATYWYSKNQIMRVNYLALYDENLEEVARSLPFIMNEVGNEIINGMTLRDSMLYFTWSFDDKDSYLGTIALEDALHFIENNPHPLS